MKTFNSLLFALILFCTGLFSQTYNPDFLDGVVFFKLKDNVAIESDEFIKKLPYLSETNKFVSINDYPEIKSALSGYSVTKLERPSYYTKIPQLMRIFRVYFSNFSEIDNIIRDLQQLDFIEYAETAPIRKIDFIPNDTYYSQSNYKWYFTLVSAEQAWNISLGDNAIKVAIVDNAVFCGHLDLTTFKQRDVADSDNDATPPLDANADFTWSHGTHCAGLATADINNSMGMTSLGANVELIGVKCTPDAGSSGAVYYGYDGVQWACQNGANVVSLSWGGSGYNSSEQTLINNYPAVVFLAAAGNDGVSTVFYPGGYNNVICVGSVDADDSRSSFSNYNGSTTWVDIASPGGYSYGGLLNTVYTTGGNNYGQMGGTSMATPFAAGLTGLMLSLNPSLSPAEILSCMTSTGAAINQNIGPRINAYGALQCVQSTLTGDPMANFIADNQNITVGNSVNFTDLSNNGGNAITNWEWTFTGGLPASYTGQIPPAVTYSAIGTYTVILTVTNSQSSDSETKTDYINVTVEPYGGWIEQVTGFSTQYRGINYISIVNENVVWGTAYDGSGGGANIQEFTKTTNGGTTWTPGTINVGNTGLGISMIHAYDATTAWLAAYPNATGQTGGIWKTTNGGTTWVRQNTATFNNASSFTNVVYFWDANTGFCQGDPINSEFELYTTTNGGTTWTLVPGANIPAPLSGEYGYTRQIEVVGDVVWFTTNMGRIYKSTDKGINWVVYQSPITDFGGATISGNLSFKDANNGIIVDVNNVVYNSTNGGANWNTVTTSGTIYNAGLCWVEGTDIIFTTGITGSSFSEDGGVSWNPIDADQHTAVEFINQSTGWSGWFNDSQTTKGIWKWQNTSTLVADFTGVPTIICVGGTVNFTDQTSGGTPTTWQWSFPSGTPATSTVQNPAVTYNTAGTYSVTLTVNDGNGAVIKTITNYITVNGAPTQPSVVTGNSIPCIDAVETYSVILAYGVTYDWVLPSGWSGTSTTNSISATVGATSGTITVTPSNSCGQGTARTFSVTIGTIPIASFSYADNLGVVTFTNTSSPSGTSYYWDFDDGNTSTQQNPVHTYTVAGNYNVMFIVTNSCGSDTVYQAVNVTVIGVNEIDGVSMRVYPVPADEILFIELTDHSLPSDYSMTDINGKTVLSGTVKSDSNIHKIDISKLAKGIYTLSLNVDNKAIKSKILID
ncbi:MAG: S8 family serine peptidase [Bacteroidota bacterium]